jgi:hypothetical protein
MGVEAQIISLSRAAKAMPYVCVEPS